MKIQQFILLSLILLSSSIMTAQFTLDAEIRPRFEYRHGYKTLFPDHADPAVFVSQRTRLNFDYQSETLHFYLSPQDVRVWGDVPQLNAADNNGMSLHQAWGEVKLPSSFAVKVGRQEIVYDDQRIFGNVDWAQQGRSHDALLLKYEPTGLKLHLGLAYNQDAEALTGNILTVNTYKALQYAWVHKDWEKVAASFLFMNHGLQYIDAVDGDKIEIRYGQTTGVHLTAKPGKFNLASNLFYQFGNDVNNNSISAYLLSLKGIYAFTNGTRMGLGGEIQSGNDYGSPADGNNNAFNPLFGTNHKFNGFMDYFYVGNHIDNVGLIDLFGNVSHNFNEKSNLSLFLHQFFAAAPLNSNTSRNLGFEMDLVTSLSLNKYAGVKAGYSHFFASEGAEVLKNNFDGNTNNWAWVMITIDPVLFRWAGEDNKE